MKEFFDSLDARVAAFFKAKFSKTVKPVAAAVDPSDVGVPIVLMMGSLTDCSAKEAHAYARGLAETYITAPELAYIRVFEDTVNGRFIYELHEGGPAVSVIEPVLEHLSAGQKVRIKLTNGAQVVIEQAHGEVFSLVYPAASEALPATKYPGLESEDSDGILQRVEELGGTVALKELYPQDKKLTHLGGIILGVGISVFMLVGGAYTINQTGILDGDTLLRQTKAGILTDTVDNPAWQLDKARNAAETSGKALTALKKGPDGWTWELSK